MRKDLREYVDYNFKKLESSNKDLKAVYEIMFRSGENILAETYEDHRIRKYTYAEVKALAEKAAAGIYEKIGATHSFVALDRRVLGNTYKRKQAVSCQHKTAVVSVKFDNVNSRHKIYNRQRQDLA